MSLWQSYIVYNLFPLVEREKESETTNKSSGFAVFVAILYISILQISFSYLFYVI